MDKKKIVVIGGGNGSAVLLQSLRPFSECTKIDAVVCMTDDGGSSGRLRKDLKVLPPGDVLRAVLALSPYDQKMLRQIFYSNRFQHLSALTGHNLGNLFLALGSHSGQDFILATRALEQSLQAVGHVHPNTVQLADLSVELTNGASVVGESKIDHPEYDRALKIKRIWIEPQVSANTEALEVIKSADILMLAPGSLYGSVIAALLPSGINEAIKESAAKLWHFSARGFRANAETGPETLSGAVFELEKYLPRNLDLIVYNSAILTEEQKHFYAQEKWGVYEMDVANLAGRRCLRFDFEAKEGGYSAEKLSVKIGEILNNEV